MWEKRRVYVAEQESLVGRGLCRALEKRGASVLPRSEDECRYEATHAALAGAEVVFCAAGQSAGIHTNIAAPVDLMLDSLTKAIAVLRAAHEARVHKLVYFASSCAYPRETPQPMPETALWTGPLEPTSAPYASAKLAGALLVEAHRRQHRSPFVTVIPADPFGPGDDFDPASSHVVAALIRRFHEAKVEGRDAVTVWGTGRAQRDFVYVDDLCEAALLVAERYDDSMPINLGSGRGTSVAVLAETVAEVVGFRGELCFDASKGDGAPLKVLDSGRLRALGFEVRTPLREALASTYRWFLENVL